MAENIIHVYLLHDLQEHLTVGHEILQCPCKPRSELVDGGMIVVHNSFDGRELLEYVLGDLL